MKKGFIVSGLIILVAVLVTAAVLLKDNSKAEMPPIETTTAVPFKNAQTGVVVDNWLKIIGIDEYNGRLAVVAENVSDTDVEYSVLTVKTKTGTLTFNVSALLRGAKAVLLCNEEVACDPNEVYTAWKTEDKVLFEERPVMNEEKFEVKVAEGSVSVKNICGENIESDIFVYYKDKDGELLNGSITYKIRVAGLKADSQTFVKAPELNPNNCQVIFTDYDD